jgi:hypothetical protein
MIAVAAAAVATAAHNNRAPAPAAEAAADADGICSFSYSEKVVSESERVSSNRRTPKSVYLERLTCQVVGTTRNIGAYIRR